MSALGFGYGTAAQVVNSIVSSNEDVTLAVITDVVGASYRPLGAMMAIFADGQRVGSLSSGCVEKDIENHAARALEEGKIHQIRYGVGSPFFDIQLPCGGGLEITLVPRPDREVMAKLAGRLGGREVTRAVLDLDLQQISVRELGGSEVTGWQGQRFQVVIEPELNFLLFGKGTEIVAFAALVSSLRFGCIVLSGDQETLDEAKGYGCDVRSLKKPGFPSDLNVDAFTAICLFFHDHDWEPPILAVALDSPAFYIGCQGSERAAESRREELKNIGIGHAKLAQLRGPIGLVKSAKDARTLSIGVLAEILVVHRELGRTRRQ
jgi:xanthine dehydrogenase accessory factor